MRSDSPRPRWSRPDGEAAPERRASRSGRAGRAWGWPARPIPWTWPNRPSRATSPSGCRGPCRGRRSWPATSSPSGCSTRSSGSSSTATSTRSTGRRSSTRWRPCEATVGERPADRDARRPRDGLPAAASCRRVTALRELLLTNLAATNPAIGSLQPLVDDTPLVLAPDARYGAVVTAIRRHFASGPRVRAGRPGPGQPARGAGPRLARVPGGPARVRARPLGAASWARPAGASSIACSSASGSSRRKRPGSGAGVPDPPVPRWAAWAHSPATPARPGMPSRSGSATTWPGCRELVLLAKSTYVWLDQLSRAYGRPIRTPRPDPRRGARPAGPARGDRAVAHRPVGAQPALARHQAAARQPRGRRLRLLADGLPRSRRTSAARRPIAEPARPRLGARHPARERHGAQPHGHRFALGRGAPRLVHPASRAALSGVLASTARTSRPTSASASTSRTTTSTTPTRRWSSSASIAGAARSATSTTATTARRCRGTTRRSSTTSGRTSARRSSRRSSTSRATSRSSASTPR